MEPRQIPSDVDSLDGYAECTDTELRLMQQEWVIAHDIKPEFADGTEVEFVHALRPCPMVGKIAGVDSHRAAHYRIQVHGSSTTRYIVPFERVKAVVKEMANA